MSNLAIPLAKPSGSTPAMMNYEIAARARAARYRDGHHKLSKALGDLITSPGVIFVLQMVGEQLRSTLPQRDSAGWPISWIVRRLRAIGVVPPEMVVFHRGSVALHPAAAEAVGRLLGSISEAVGTFTIEMAEVVETSQKVPAASDYDPRMDEDVDGMED